MNKRTQCELNHSLLIIAYLLLAETSQEHLQTKKQVEELRERFGGDHWLHSHSGSFVQDLMGLQKSTGTGILSSTPLGRDVLLSSSPKFLPPFPKVSKAFVRFMFIRVDHFISFVFVTNLF